MDIICSKCGKKIPLSQACVCDKCGEIVCAKCAEKSFYYCSAAAEITRDSTEVITASFFSLSSWNIALSAPEILNLKHFRVENTALARNLRLPSRLGPEVGASLFYVAKLRFIPQNLNCMP